MPQIDKIRDKVREIQEDDIDVVFKRYPLKNPTHPTTFKELVEDAAAAALACGKITVTTGLLPRPQIALPLTACVSGQQIIA